jgi:hypothetical protein
MPLPTNFSGPPNEELHRYFRNLCIDFRKLVTKTKDTTELAMELERLVNASRQLDWHNKRTGVYHKNEGDKAIHKVWAECQRYIDGLKQKNSDANPQDLLDALSNIESLINSLKVT